MNVVHFVPCGLSLTMACNHEQRSRRNCVMPGSLVLRLPRIENKAAFQYNGEKSGFCLLFSNLEILCRFITFILLPMISSTETISEQFWCKLEKICCLHKISPAGKDGLVVKVRHVDFVFVPRHFPKKKKSSLPCIKTIKLSTDFPF